MYHSFLIHSSADGHLEPIIQSEVRQKEKHQYSILTHIYGRKTNDLCVPRTGGEIRGQTVRLDGGGQI